VVIYADPPEQDVFKCNLHQLIAPGDIVHAYIVLIEQAPMLRLRSVRKAASFGCRIQPSTFTEKLMSSSRGGTQRAYHWALLLEGDFFGCTTLCQLRHCGRTGSW
jgi:hypothetical protein